MHTTDQEQSARTFVRVLAWIFIVLGTMTLLVSVMQNIMFHSLMEFGQLQRELAKQPRGEVPAVFIWMMRSFPFLLAAMLMISLLTLISSIGLLKYQAWARLVFMGLMLFGIVFNLGGWLLQVSIFFSAPFKDVPSGVGSLVFWIVLAFSGLFSLMFCILFGWIWKRLGSAPVRSLFAGSSV